MRAVKQAVIDPETKKPKPGKFELMWQGWCPKSTDPYAVKRGRKIGWVPPRLFVPIPIWWAEKHPKELKEWLEWVTTKW